jgi:hypothetical protein
MVDKNRCKLYELYNLQNFTNGQQPQAGSGAVWDLNSNAMRPVGWTSADAAGLPITPLLLRPDEILAGTIAHAIRFTAHCTNSYIWPASHQAGLCSTGFPPMGARFRLRASFNISGFAPTTQVVLRAFQHYGVVLADNGSDWFFSGTTDDWWGTTAGDQVVTELKTIPAAQFDAVDETTLQVASGSYQALSGAVTIPCATPSLGGSPVSPGATGASVVFTASTTVCANPRYRFWVGRGGAWAIAQDYSAANTFTWNATGLAGSYGIEVDVRDATSSAPYDAVRNITYSLNACSAAGVGAAPSAPQLPGATITVTGSSTCPSTATYRFWVGQGGGWSIVQDYSTTNTFSWNTTGKPFGTYGLEVDVRDQGATASYEKVANMTYFLGTSPCTTPTLGAGPLSPGPTGGSVLFTASTSGCPTPNYRFWVGQGGAWRIVRDYSAANTFTWTGTGAAGSYGIEVDVRNAGSAVSYDHVRNITYSLAGCSAAHLATDKASPQPHGTTIVLTGSATCGGTPEYRFWVRDLSGRWMICQDYSSAATHSWITTGLAPGTYGLEVDVRNQGATAVYETVANLTFQVT